MDLVLSLIMFLIGLVLVIYFSERLVEGTVGVSLNFGISAFLISVIFIGFDPENLGLGAVASAEQVTGIALGTILGAAMVAIALAFGITAILAPMEFGRTPKQILAIPVLATVLLSLLMSDGLLSRIDGGILMLGFVVSIGYLVRVSRKGYDIKAVGEVEEVLEKEKPYTKWKSAGLFFFSLFAIIAGSEMLIAGSEPIVASLGLSDTLFGMTILALLVSIEELARELPAARRGRPEISFGNVTGSILAFFLFNAGIIALIRPQPIGEIVLYFYLPMAILTVITVMLFAWKKKISRWAGVLLLLLYGIFFFGGYFLTS